jgi:hypothetical protein
VRPEPQARSFGWDEQLLRRPGAFAVPRGWIEHHLGLWQRIQAEIAIVAPRYINAGMMGFIGYSALFDEVEELPTALEEAPWYRVAIGPASGRVSVRRLDEGEAP